MKKILESRLGETIIFIVSTTFHLLFSLIAYSLKLIGNYKGKSIWQMATLYKNRPVENYLCVAFIVIFVLEIVLFLVSTILLVLKKKRLGYYVLIPWSLISTLVILFVHIRYGLLGALALVCFTFAILFSSVALVYLIYRHIACKDFIEEDEHIEYSKFKNLYKRIILIMEWVSLGLFFTIFIIPMYTATEGLHSTSYFLIYAMTDNSYPIYIYIFFILFFVGFLLSLLYLISTLSYYFKSDKAFIKSSKNYLYSNIVFTLLFFLAGYFVSFYINIKKGDASSIAFIPLLLMAVLFIGYSIIQGKLGIHFDETKQIGSNQEHKLEPLLCIILLTGITFLTLAFNVIEIKTTISSFKSEVSLSGYKLLTTYKDLSGGFQVLAFSLFGVLFISAVLFLLSLVGYFSKYKEYPKIIKLTAIANVVFMLLIGLYGFYFKIAQKINEENILSVLTAYNISLPTNYEYKVSSQSIYLFVASLAVLIFMLVRGLFNYKIEDIEKKPTCLDEVESSLRTTDAPAIQFDFDACPAFTELDSKLEQFKEDLEERRMHLFENLTLPNLVRFVVDYARECRLHLSYSLEDIATFVAGLGASRLSILQGMSGTGKTSLPKIFAEAILGTCEVVEVESSWRDKNELLGYYNEFSKCFTPKKFTQCLYKARLNSEIPTFIVLDEMNLSRIEYYFSDFLSLMEHEEHLRKIKLLNVKLYRTLNQEQISYYGLTDDHTIDIPTNVWFIGTANRDESTFEISDKVYDRAQTMNFNKRAPKIHSFSEPLDQRFVTYEGIANLFKEAKESYSFDAEENKIIQKVEKLLLPYNISFGNRILKQMEDFVKIYCACFGDKDAVLNDAVEKILLSKVVSKLEVKIVENKEALAIEFDKLGLSLCSAFVRKLNED
ncbi:MAG: AAA family ATPase [Anaeroplasma bactoclasticum]|nr:AAA family ATPase [Anaeroplasma bactoclasticum]